MRDDHAGSPKTKLIRAWFTKRPRWHVHFTPTSASWRNQVERFFGSLTERALRRGVHRSSIQLEAAIHAYIDAHNAAPKPFRWTKTADGKAWPHPPAATVRPVTHVPGLACHPSIRSGPAGGPRVHPKAKMA